MALKLLLLTKLREKDMVRGELSRALELLLRMKLREEVMVREMIKGLRTVSTDARRLLHLTKGG